MKRLFLSVFILFSIAFGNSAVAQPTLTAASNNLIVGDQIQATDLIIYTWHFNDAIPTGPAHIWGFPFLNLSSRGIMPIEVASRAVSPNSGSLPAANMVLKKGVAHTYLENNGTSLKDYGTYNAFNNNYFSQNTDPAEIMRFPFTYTSTFSDTFSGTSIFNGTTDSHVGTITVTGEGYGTLVLPTGTFQNVLKVKTVEIANSQNYGQYNYVIYDWYLPGVHFPILQISSYNSGASYSGYYLSTILGAKEEMSSKVKLKTYPNPASSEVIIQYQTPEPVKITLLDLVGKQIAVLHSGKGSIDLQRLKLDVSKYPKGLYLLQLETEGETASQKLILQ